jgi:hypothetical protein
MGQGVHDYTMLESFHAPTLVWFDRNGAQWLEL